VTDQTHFRSRVVIADCGGQAGAFGPVHTERGLAELAERLRAAGWFVRGDMKLTSMAQFKQHPAAWEAMVRDAQDGRAGGVE
jgi:hypothetical protein